MSKWSRSPEATKADIAYAVGEDIDVIEHLKQQHHARGWNGGVHESE